MKTKLFSLSALAILGAALFGMTACSDKDEVAGSENATNDAKQYLAVNIRNVQSAPSTLGAKAATRADNPVFEDGTDLEQKIFNVRFYFFNTDGTPFRLSNNDGHNWINVSGDDLTKDTESSSNIEEKTKAVLLIQNNTGASPSGMIAIVNPQSFVGSDGVSNPLMDDDGTPKDLSLNQLRADALTAANAYNASSGSSFVMSNSVFENNGTSTCAALTAGHIATSSDAALANPVDVYVERVNAKVRAHLSGSSTSLPADKSWGSITASSDIVATAYVNGADQSTTIVTKGTTYPAFRVGRTHDKDIYALVLGWGLADENGIATLEKNIGSSTDWEAWVLNNFIGIDPWTSSDYHRCYWEKSPEVAIGAGRNNPVDHSWNSYNTGLTSTASSLYTLPNTANSTNGYTDCDKNISQTTFTKLLAKTVLVYNNGTETDPDWKPAEICTYNNEEYFGLSDLRTVIANEYSKYYTMSLSGNTTVYTALQPSDITFSTEPQANNTKSSVKDYQVVPCVKDGTYYIKNANGTYSAVTAADVNSNMDDKVADVRNAGMSYYYYCIRHLAKGDPTKLAYLGVVRNHIYDINIKSITGFGTPVYDPDKDIVPMIPNNDATFLAADLNVISWRVVSQDADLDATAK